MSFTHTIKQEWSNGNGGRTITASVSTTGSAQQSLQESIADSSTDLEVGFTLDVSAVKSIYIKSDYAITIETNDGSTPDNTLSLAAGVPYVWHENAEDAFVFDTDITSIFVTNASGSAATLQIEVLVDATP